MPTTIVPLNQLVARPPEHGRIRFGVKAGRAMKAIETWRFTSPDEAAIRALAELYGGTAKKWSDPKASPPNQWEVVTDADTINVWLPPGAYNVSYELWGGGGVERRCDGATCLRFGREPVPCMCDGAPDGAVTCRPTSRVSVILPDIAFGGVWRLETKSWNFAHEAPGMIAAISEMQAQGLARVSLILSKRQQKVEGQTKKFIVPQFSLDATPTQMLNGAARVRAGLTAGAAPRELGAGPVAPIDEVWHQPAGEIEDTTDYVDLLQRSVDMLKADADDDIEDAEVIEEDGWDIPPPGVKVRRNPDKAGPRWIRKQ